MTSVTLRITFFAISAFLFFRVEGLAQLDAQDRTQTFFDNNKGADVVNPNRAITDRIRQRQELSHKSTLPPLKAVPKAEPSPKRKVNTKQVRDLRKERDAFIEKQVTQAEKAQAVSQNAQMQMLAEATPASVDKRELKKSAKQAWDRSPKGKKLQQLESGGGRGSYLPPLTK